MNPFLGEIIMFGGNFAPRGWAKCDGQILPINSNQSLFSILGTTYGGDGRTSFALPDLRGRVPLHAGNGAGLSNRTLGQKGGEETHTLITNELPAHSHTVKVNLADGVSNTTTGNDNPLGNQAALNIYDDADDIDTGKTVGGISCANTGGNLEHENEQPYLVVNYIIALQGVFPSRN